MFRKCCVSKCNSKRQDAKLHKFPINKEMQQKWRECLSGRIDNASELTNLHVCHKHFETRHVNSETSRLKSSALPTLFSDLELSSGQPSNIPVSIDVDNSVQRDHCYSRKRHFDHTYVRLYDQSPSTSASPVISDANEVPMPTIQIPASPVMVQQSVLKTPKKLQKRVIRNVKSLTPKCRMLYTQYKKMKNLSNYKERVNRALVFSKKKSLEELTEKMNPLTRKLLLMQVKLCTKRKKARRFTTEEKLIALAIYKQGPKSYKFLQKIFILPSKTTLKKMTSKLNISAGINPQIFELIKNQVKGWDSKKKLCNLLFDEMALETAVTFCENKDNIIGFVDGERKFVDHVLVFMLRGAVCKWQQPVAFYFCEGATSRFELKILIKEVIAAVTDTGLIPVGLVCDQGTNFQSAINDLLEESKRDQLHAGENFDNTINLNNNKLSVFYDPPHLIKGVRNNLLNKDMLYEGKTVKWQDIVDVYNADCHHGESRILHKLTDQHVIPGKIKKMKVKNCVRVLSKSVAAALSYTSKFPLYPDGKPVSSTMKDTADAVSFLDDLFDSVNGATLSYKNVKGKSLLSAVTSKTQHHDFWRVAIKKLQNMKFVTKDNQCKTVPSLKNWVVTLKSMQRVWEHYKQSNIKIMRPRYFNSDPLENFFGQVRAYNYRSNDPSAYAFINTFKSLLLTRFINFHSESYNCENDASQDLLNLQSLFTAQDVSNAPVVSENREMSTKETEIIINTEGIQKQARRQRINVHSRAYTVGWIIRKLFAKLTCKTCKNNLISENEEAIHTYIKHKEYKTIKDRKLVYPTEHAVRCFGYIVETTNEYLENYGYQNDLSKKIKEQVFSNCSFEFIDCDMHKAYVRNYFADMSIKLFIYNWCNVINKILKGTDITRLENKQLPPMQMKALEKFKKKLKNKKLYK